MENNIEKITKIFKGTVEIFTCEDCEYKEDCEELNIIKKEENDKR